MFREYYLQLSNWFDPYILIYFGLINLVYTVLLILGAVKVFRRKKDLNVEDLTTILRSDSLPEITIMAPAYNEAENIAGVIDNLLNLTYRYKKILIVNDGSTDNTFEIMREKLKLLPIPRYYEDVLPTKPVRGIYRSSLYPEVVVIDKENGTRFDALNAGLNACSTYYFIRIDADTFIDNQCFEALIRPILSSPESIAIGASIRVKDGCVLEFNRINTERFPSNYISAMQSLEYLRAFLMRQGWDYTGGNYLLSGAFSIYVKEVVVHVGGYAPTIGEDMEIVLRLNRIFRATKTNFEIVYYPDPVAWTTSPKEIKVLGSQRKRWHRGALETIWFHKRLFFNPKYGKFGLWTYPFLVIGEAMEPIFEIMGYLYILVGLYLEMIDPLFITFFLLLTFGFTSIYTLTCLLIEELSFRKFPSLKSVVLIFVYSLVENLGYRQMTLYYRLMGFVGFFKEFKEVRQNSRSLNESIKKIVEKGKIKW